MSDPAQFLLRHFDRLAEAPGGIAKLRALIVQLGIQGKLIAQNKNDEPVTNLLARIRSARPKLIAAGEAQKLKELPEIADDDLPFEIPYSWQWVRLAEVTAYIQRGKSPVYEPGSTKFVLNQKCIQWDGLHLEYAKEISGASLDRYEQVRFLRSGDILWNSTGTGTIGRCLVFRPTAKTPPKLAVDGHVTVVRTIEVDPDYIRRWLMSPFVYGVIEERASGATNQVELTSTMSTEQLISLPPLAEQRRIVAKVEEFMALCDTLEAAQRERETVRTHLRTSALHQLASPDSDSKSAAFVLQHLPRFTTEPEELADIRQSVLQLAVQGRLLKQNPTEKISQELANRPTLSGSDTLGAPHDIPPSWRWSSIAAVAAKITDGEHLSPTKAKEGVMLLTAKHIRDASVSFEDPQFVSHEDAASFRVRCDPQRDDILICSRGTIGRCALVESDTIFCLMGSVILIRPPKEISPRFLLTFLRTDWAQQAMRGLSGATAVNALYLKDIRKCPIPLPPLAEQRRIVAKVDELMAVLAALEATLTTARTMSERLLAALIAKLHAT
jgi:type I restriction enzyme S subunit